MSRRFDSDVRREDVGDRVATPSRPVIDLTPDVSNETLSAVTEALARVLLRQIRAELAAETSSDSPQATMVV